MSMDPAMPDWRAFGQPATTAAAPQPEVPPRASALDALRRLPRSTQIALGIALAIALGGLGLAVFTPTGGDVAIDDGSLAGMPAGAATSLVDAPAFATMAATAPPAMLVVDVAGAVARPGLLRLPAGSRVGDAVAAAGGYAPTADLDAAARDLNLAAPLADGAKVLVPTLGTPPTTASSGAPAAGGGAGSAAGGRLDLNTADQAALEDLPGIGPVTAGRILESRAEAPFAAVDELRGRGLVGESTFTKLRDLVTVAP
jgi:competence protein ComEA